MTVCIQYVSLSPPLSLSITHTHIYNIYIYVYMRVFFACNTGRATEYVDLPEFSNGPILASKTN